MPRSPTGSAGFQQQGGKGKDSPERKSHWGEECQAEELGGGTEEFIAKGQALRSQGNILNQG